MTNNQFKNELIILQKEFYKEYIKSDNWKWVRRAVLNRDKNICQDCGMIAGYVHHLNYSHLSTPDEINFCITLCKWCHTKRHNIKPTKEVIQEHEQSKNLQQIINKLNNPTKND